MDNHHHHHHHHHHHQKREKEVDKQSEEAKLKQQAQLSIPSPPSPSSSPSHEFSFTISLHPTTTKAAPPSIAIDLSPADDIFFHGHLLPLQLLSHLPSVSPRSSTNSHDSFTLPIRELLQDQHQNNPTTNNNNSTTYNKHYQYQNNNSTTHETKARTKSKSFSFFGLPKWRKGSEDRETEDYYKEKPKKKMKMRFDVSHVLKKYIRMVNPLLSFRGRRENVKMWRQPSSFSGNLSMRPGKQEFRGRRGELSAPASMRTSPTNSGLLVATPTTSTSNSTMEELQAAIQAAIVHCKNSIAVEEKVKVKD